MPATHVEFTPAASAVLPTPHTPTAVALPPPDPANPAVVLRNLGHNPVVIKAGSVGGAHVNQPGTIMLHGGQVILTRDAGLATCAEATVHAMPGIPMTGDGAMLPGPAHGTGLSFTRGSLRDVWLFLAPAEAVI